LPVCITFDATQDTFSHLKRGEYSNELKKSRFMKVQNITILILMFFTISCSSDENTELDCINSKLEEFDMIEYSGQELSCKSFLELYKFKNKQYFLLGNHCADIISNPIDCDGNILCGNEDNSECEEFFINANLIGIVGIEK